MTSSQLATKGLQAYKDAEQNQIPRMLDIANNLSFLKGKISTPVINNQAVLPSVNNELFTTQAYSQSSSEKKPLIMPSVGPDYYNTVVLGNPPTNGAPTSSISLSAQLTPEIKTPVQTETGIKGFISNTLRDPKKMKEYGIIASLVILVLIIIFFTLKK